ncbi:glycosyltransferase [Demequina flava]|uniref:glycosyltransferase n=1 Tax=Demequina flava TaxID=1095025 RepID=UPI000783EC8C|nr:glycosyltransferase [Demequina flava]
MRIAHIANFYGPRSGGLRTAMNALGSGYVERGHDVLTIVPGARDGLERTSHGTHVTLRSAAVPGTGGYRLITRTDAVRRVLTRFRPDVLEVSDRTTLRSTGAWAAARGIPTVFFAHERADGVLRAHAPRIASSEWARRAVDNHTITTHSQFTTVVCTTSYAAGEFARLGLSTVHVPLGVDLDRFNPLRADPDARSSYAGSNEVLLVMASRLSTEKRPDLAIDAVRHLHASGRQVRLVVAGAGPQERRMRAAARGLPVDFLGFIRDPARFATLLATADAVVAPGPIETFGLAALEALASGTPVVVNRASALPEVVGDAGLAARGTPGDFAAAVSSVLARDARVRRERARARAEQWPWSRSVDAMEEVHAQIRARATTEKAS